MTVELEVLPEIIPNEQLAEINATNANLQQLLDRAKEYAVMNPDTLTKETAKEVHDFVQMAVKTRTGAMKLAKELAAPYQQKADEIMGEGKRIGNSAKEAEDIARPTKDAYEARLEAERKEREAAAAVKIVERNNAVIALGMECTGTTYVLGEHIIESVDIRGASDEDWTALMAPIIEAVNAERELAEVARQKATDDAEAARKKLAEDQAEVARQQAEMRQQQQDFLKQQQELRQQQESMQRAEREKADEAARIEAEAEAVAARIEKEAADKQREAEEKAAASAKLKADKERTKRLAPDRKALLRHIGVTVDVMAPELSQPETTALLTEFTGRLNKLADEFISELDAL